MRDLYARFVLWLIRPALERNERLRAAQAARLERDVLDIVIPAVIEANRRTAP